MPAMPDLNTMLSDNQVTLDRTVKRLEKAGLSLVKRASPGELLKRLDRLRLPKKVHKAQQAKSFDEIRKQIEARK